MSYLKSYVQGKLPIYNPPPGEFTSGKVLVLLIASCYFGAFASMIFTLSCALRVLMLYVPQAVPEQRAAALLLQGLPGHPSTPYM